MLDSILPIDLTWNDYKSRLYQVLYRPKLKETFFNPRIEQMIKTIDLNRKFKPNYIKIFGKKEQLIDLILEK